MDRAGQSSAIKVKRIALLAGLSFFCIGLLKTAGNDAVRSGNHPDRSGDDWPFYGHDAGGMRYSPLAQINRQNVSTLKVAWVFHAGDISKGDEDQKRGGLETTPLLVDGTLFLTTGFNRVIALDPRTGVQRWAYDPEIDLAGDYGDGLINRGVATWLDPARHPGQPCRRRIFESTLDARLIALDAATGAPCADFGRGGEVSLRNVARYHHGWYHMTSPPAVIDALVVVGSAIDDNARVDMASGVVRAFDARSGALRWSWQPIPPNTETPASDGPTQAGNDQAGSNQPSKSPAKIWRSGAANAWSVMAVDPGRHLIFVPTGSASPDYYGGLRPGDDKWADSVVALRSQTGQLVWGFQLVHHDLWDYDSASPPLLATLERNGRPVPVVIQGNKTGFLYVLNRESGEPVFPIEERSVPQSDVPGEVASPTQPFPTAPPALSPQRFTPGQAWGITPADRDTCRNWVQGLRNDGIFTPPSLRGTLAFPGNLGGMNWSGYAFDPARSLLVVNSNNLAAKVRLIPSEHFYDDDQRTEKGEYSAQRGAPYGMYRRFLLTATPLPCNPPPWGLLTAVDLKQGKIRWQVPLGSFAPGQPAVPPGTVSLGGPIVTAGGLIFIAGTYDPFIRAFDTDTGKELWKMPLPASGHATPMTYQIGAQGKQYLVIAAGGHPKIEQQPLSDAIVAFALP